MKNADPIYSFVMKGLLTEVELEKTQILKKTKITEDELKKIEDSLGISGFDDEFVVQAKKMAVVYTAIYAFEKSVRTFVAKKMFEVHGENWWNTCVTEKIQKKAESRKEEESKVRWHTPRGDTIINYTELGDLISIIRTNWTDFEAHIPTQEWADSIIKTIERSRNVIMHSGELVNHDIERVGMFIRDWTNQVG